jgi:hypothetical protein
MSSLWEDSSLSVSISFVNSLLTVIFQVPSQCIRAWLARGIYSPPSYFDFVCVELVLNLRIGRDCKATAASFLVVILAMRRSSSSRHVSFIITRFRSTKRLRDPEFLVHMQLGGSPGVVIHRHSLPNSLFDNSRTI